MKAKIVKTGKARVLMSSECLRILLKKEEEKKRIAQEKERRKQERESKKKQKEEEQKRKAEEKVCKAAEREAAKALKEAAEADREAAKLAEREKELKMDRRDKHVQWQLQYILNEINLKRMLMSPSMLTFVASVSGHTRRTWALVENGFSAVAVDGFMKIVWTMRMWKKIVEGCVPCVRKSQYCVHLLHNILCYYWCTQKLLHKKSTFSTGKG